MKTIRHLPIGYVCARRILLTQAPEIHGEQTVKFVISSFRELALKVYLLVRNFRVSETVKWV